MFVLLLKAQNSARLKGVFRIRGGTNNQKEGAKMKSVVLVMALVVAVFIFSVFMRGVAGENAKSTRSETAGETYFQEIL